jgi:hypothetical protein
MKKDLLSLKGNFAISLMSCVHYVAKAPGSVAATAAIADCKGGLEEVGGIDSHA